MLCPFYHLSFFWVHFIIFRKVLTSFFPISDLHLYWSKFVETNQAETQCTENCTFYRHGGATALLYLFWIVATLVMVATQTLILVRRNEIIDHFDKHASFWKNNQAKNCKRSKRVIIAFESI